MAVIKNYPLKLNRDDDVRRLEPIDMTDALNVYTTKSSGRDEGVLEYAKGNTKVNVTLPAGTNVTIGSIAHPQSNNLFYFNWNSNGDHCIYYINDITQNIRLVLQSSVLNFNKNGFIVGEAYQGRNSDEILLYFTDNINPPRKVNVQKAINGNYTTVTDEIISLAKYAPFNEPTWVYTQDNSVVYNNVYNKHFTFRYRYLFDDGEYSAYSYGSTITVNDEQLLASLKDTADPYNNLNNIRVLVDNGSEIVDKIEVIAREGDDGEWRIIKTLKNNPNNDTVDFDFKNDGAYPLADPIETNKYFDNVPLQAESLAFVNSRMFMGNYVDGFDLNEDIKALTNNNGEITLNYRSENFDIPLRTAIPATSPLISGTVLIFYVNYSSYIAGVNEGDLFTFSLNSVLKTTSNPNINSPKIFSSYKVNSGDTINDVIDNLISNYTSTFDIELGSNLKITREIYSTGGLVAVKYTLSNPNYFWQNPDVNNFSGFWDALSASPSFKKGSKYSLALIEYDEVGRASTANIFPDNEVYIPFYSEVTPNTKDMLGNISIDYRISQDIKPSLRARKWSWAITENTSVGEFIQYSSTGAYSANNPIYPDDDTVYLSLRGLQSQNSSYNIEFGAEAISYNYADGDRLRVISYIDDAGNRVMANGSIDFRITSGRIYGEDDSPIYNSATDSATKNARTGYIIGLQNTNQTEWSADASSFWNKTSTQAIDNEGAVIFEIYSPKSQSQEEERVFYEVGGINLITDAGLSTRKFNGSLRIQGDSLSYAVASQSSESFLIASNSINFVIGDTLIFKTGGGTKNGEGTITDIQPVSGGTRVYMSYDLYSPIIPFATAELNDKPAAGNIVGGDVWVRPRFIRNDNFINSTSYIIFPVEDYNISDFYNSRSWGKGRPNGFVENAKEVRRFSTVTYSEPYFTDTNVNGLSSFNIALANFEQYSQSYGAIRRLFSNDVFLNVFQENKIGRVPINRRVIETADGNTSLTLSQNVLNEIDYYKGDYGLTKAESFVAYDGDFFGWDIKRSKVWELNASGVQLVSDYKMSSYFEEKSSELLPYYKTTKVIIGLDREFDCIYVSTIGAGVKQQLTDGTNKTAENFAVVDTDATNLYIRALQEKTSSNALSNVLSEINRALSDIDASLANLGDVSLNLNLVPENAAFEYTGNIRTSGTIDATFKVQLGAVERFAIGTYNFETSEIVIPKTQEGFTIDVDDETSEYNGFTLGYNSKDNAWISFYSFIPEMYGAINYSCYSFKDGEIYKHNTNETRNNFYGVQYNSHFEVNFNQEPSRVKLFDAMAIEGNTGDFAISLTTNLNSSSLPSGYFNEKEGFFQSMLPRTTTQSSFSNILGGGSGVFSGTSLTIDGLDAYDLGVQVGDEVWKQTLVGVVTEIVSADTVVVSSNQSPGFFYFVRPSSIIDGDRLRGYYLTAKLTSTSTDFVEVFAVSAEVTNSKLHNT